MTTTSHTVVGMSCDHCVRVVTEAVGKIDGVTGVQVDLTTGQVTVESDRPLDENAFATAVDEAGYEVAR